MRRKAVIVCLHTQSDIGRHAHVIFVGRGEAPDDIDEAALGAHATAGSKSRPGENSREWS